MANAVTEVISKLCWFGALVGAGAGGFVGFVTIASASGAPQQAAGAAMARLIAIVPYVFARSIQELFRD